MSANKLPPKADSKTIGGRTFMANGVPKKKYIGKITFAIELVIKKYTTKPAANKRIFKNLVSNNSFGVNQKNDQ